MFACIGSQCKMSSKANIPEVLFTITICVIRYAGRVGGEDQHFDIQSLIESMINCINAISASDVRFPIRKKKTL